MKRHEFDGVLMGDSTGHTWKVYEPRWWHFGRWIRWYWRWWFTGSRFDTSTVTCTQNEWSEEHGRWSRRTLELRAFLKGPGFSLPPGEN